MQLRTVRSFSRRCGRITSGAKKALEQSPYLRVAEGLCLPEGKPKTLDIGFGMGHSILALAQANPDRIYVGVEVHTPGAGRVLSQIQQLGLTNVYVIHADVQTVLPHLCDFDEVLLWFPDPWPKTHHHKRRIVSLEFLEKVARVLVPGGRFHMATDWEDYAKFMLKTAKQSPYFENPAPGFTTVARPLTNFCARGRTLGHGEWDIVLTKKITPPHAHAV